MHQLQKYLTRKRVKAREFAKTLEMSESHLSRILSGERKPSLGLLRRMAEKTGIAEAELLRDVPMN